MVSARDTDASKLIEKTAEQLKEKIQMPEWALNVKTGMHKERPPEQSNWWQLRAASILRKVYVDGPVGVSRLRSFYGGRHRRGHKPPHFAKGSGKILRVILQDLEKQNLIKKMDKRKGRIITPEGQKFLDGIAKSIKA
ncbi:MAG TPA: 30S ribosomal protein S19e [archaeon]|nr:30S ribosomal protein S19e [archaeon]